MEEARGRRMSRQKEGSERGCQIPQVADTAETHFEQRIHLIWIDSTRDRKIFQSIFPVFFSLSPLPSQQVDRKQTSSLSSLFSQDLIDGDSDTEIYFVNHTSASPP